MITHRFKPEKYFNVIGTIKPEPAILPGDRAVTTIPKVNGFDRNMVKQN